MVFTMISSLFFMSVFAQESKQIAVSAKLKIENNAGLIDIAAIASNADEIFQSDLEYVLLVLKTTSMNTLEKNMKEGEFSLGPNENKLLNNMKVSMQQNELLKLYLFIRKENKLISKDTLHISSMPRIQTSQEIEESFEIKGLVVDNVITKLGKDFYDYFYQKYSASSVKYPFVIKIEERPKLGISSDIIIKIDDLDVYSMITNPNQEYLEASAQQAMVTIQDYYQRRQLLKQATRKF